MKEIGKKILEARRNQGLSQEDLAELARVNLRTIQRIENNENDTRVKTLNLVCNALDIKFENTEMNQTRFTDKFHVETLFNYIFLLVLNIILISIVGFLVVDSESNFNSKIGGFLLSFFVPAFITFKTQNLSGSVRVLKFGFGYFFYFFLSLISHGFPHSFVTGLVPCLVLAIATLYYGNYFLSFGKSN